MSRMPFLLIRICICISFKRISIIKGSHAWLFFCRMTTILQTIAICIQMNVICRRVQCRFGGLAREVCVYERQQVIFFFFLPESLYVVFSLSMMGISMRLVAYMCKIDAGYTLESELFWMIILRLIFFTRCGRAIKLYRAFFAIKRFNSAKYLFGVIMHILKRWIFLFERA